MNAAAAAEVEANLDDEARERIKQLQDDADRVLQRARDSMAIAQEEKEEWTEGLPGVDVTVPATTACCCCWPPPRPSSLLVSSLPVNEAWVRQAR